MLWVSSVNTSGLRTQPWGAPVLSVMVPDVLLPMCTVCDLSIRKSRLQLQREVSRPSRKVSLLASGVRGYANWRGSSEVGRCLITSCSKYFIVM